jgi:hypothetical protein
VGIPSIVITRKGFSQVVGNAFAGFGFAPDGPSVYEFPLEMFLPGSDLTPINKNIDKIVYGLTKWEPKFRGKGIFYPGKAIRVEGKDYQGAIDNMNNLYLKNMWGDGLPIIPPTEERVNWLLTGTDLPQDKTIGKILARGGIATVKSLAIALAMAGGRPEYMPVLIAAVQAMIDPEMTHEHFQATTNSGYPVVIVNGPVTKQIRLNSGYGCLGPDPQHSAGGPIGRAIRFLQMNIGGAIPGIGTMAIYGGASRYTNVVFGEDEDGLPKGWEPLNVSYKGYTRGTNSVSVFCANSSINVGGGGAALTKEEVITVLDRFAMLMSAPNSSYYSSYGYGRSAPGIVFFARGTAEGLAMFGWTKEKIKHFLWEKTKIPWTVMKERDLGAPLKPTPVNLDRLGITEKQLVDPFPITSRPENIMIVVAGGAQSGHSYYMGTGQGRSVTSAKIELPAKAKWDALLAQAEKDLGPIPIAVT